MVCRCSVLLAAVSFLIGGASSANAQTPLATPQGHCRAGEVVVFDCATGRKQVSVCMSADFSAQKGHLHYRFGAPGQVEIELPRDRWKGSATEARLDTFPNGSQAGYLRFHNGPTGYVVFDSSVRAGQAWEARAGIAVEPANPRARRQIIECRNEPRASLLLDARTMRERFGFMENPEAKPFDMP